MDGNFTSWEKVGECSHSCGGGTQYQRRNCTNPMPAYGGNNCTGNKSRTISCNSQACPGIQTKEFVLSLCTKNISFTSIFSIFSLPCFILFECCWKHLCQLYDKSAAFSHKFRQIHVDGEMLFYSLKTFAAPPRWNYVLAMKMEKSRFFKLNRSIHEDDTYNILGETSKTRCNPIGRWKLYESQSLTYIWKNIAIYR